MYERQQEGEIFSPLVGNKKESELQSAQRKVTNIWKGL